MRYANLKLNDIANVQGISVSFFTQGCARRCKNCFNSDTWDFNGGKEFTQETLQTIINGINKNGVQRSLCILGGEPLNQENLFLTYMVISEVLKVHPNVKIYIWTGYTLEELLQNNSPKMNEILSKIYCLIDGPFIDELKDNNLEMRGSSNQRILYRGVDF